MKRRNFLKLTLTLPASSGLNNLLVHDRDDQQEQAGEPEPAGPQQGTVGPAELKFGVIADPQYADQPERGRRFYRKSLEKLEASIEELNRNELDLVVTLGDVIDKDYASYADIMPLYDALSARHFIVPGNHDFDVDDEDKELVLSALNISEPWKSEVLRKWRLIFLDGTDVSTYRYPEDDSRTADAQKVLEQIRELQLPNAHGWNSAVGEAQFSWLLEQLDEARDEQQRVILFCHFPVMPAGDAHNLWNADQLVEALGRYDHVAAYMNGHNHRGNYARHNGCHFINFKGMVETENETAYAIVSCFEDRIEVEGFGLEVDRELE